MPYDLMYIRFVLEQIDDRTGKYAGLFTLAYTLRDEDKLTVQEQSHVQELIDWFKANLPIPDKFSKVGTRPIKIHRVSVGSNQKARSQLVICGS